MTLLAVDLGLKTGLAWYDSKGRLLWYRSQNYGTTNRLRRGVQGLVKALPELNFLVVEGGGTLSRIWEREAKRFRVAFQQIAAEQWRDLFLLPREHKSGSEAKHFADQAARRVIAWSGLQKPTSLRHDAAEAILVGLWGVLAFGLLPELPRALHFK